VLNFRGIFLESVLVTYLHTQSYFPPGVCTTITDDIILASFQKVIILGLHSWKVNLPFVNPLEDTSVLCLLHTTGVSKLSK